jgi:hypothetical protein
MLFGESHGLRPQPQKDYNLGQEDKESGEGCSYTVVSGQGLDDKMVYGNQNNQWKHRKKGQMNYHGCEWLTGHSFRAIQKLDKDIKGFR